MLRGSNVFLSLDDAFKYCLTQLLGRGHRCSPRGMGTLELHAFNFSLLDPRRRYISIPERRWSIVYALGEFCWHARGATSVEEIASYAPKWKSFNKGVDALGSSYGAKIFNSRPGKISQWEHVRAILANDSDTRRAVLYLSGDNSDAMDDGSDIACAISLQFFLRDGCLDAVCVMRSNDVMLGMTYDVFLFTMLQEMMAVSLNVRVGHYHHFAGSLHMYDKDVALAKAILTSDSNVIEPMPEMISTSSLESFLKAERLASSVIADPEIELDRYWSALLSVIKAWHGLNDLEGEVFRVSDPILRRLFNIRFN